MKEEIDRKIKISINDRLIEYISFIITNVEVRRNSLHANTCNDVQVKHEILN